MRTTTPAKSTTATTRTTRTTGSTRAANKTPAGDAIKLLTSDHAEVHALFVDFGKLCKAGADGEDRGAIAEQICMLLTVHATIEEEIFYPAARDAGVEVALLDEAEVEHAGVKALIAEIEVMDADDTLYDAKVKVLGEYVDHHVKEEQDEMFPKCRAAKMDLKALGSELAKRKVVLLAEINEAMQATH